MVWRTILDKEKDIVFVIDILHKIAANLSQENDDIEKNSLMYGNLGKIIFLANYLKIAESDEMDEKATTLFDDVHQSFGQAIYNNLIQTINQNLDFSFKKGLSGIGWGINYLINSQFIEGDINDIMGLVDANIYRHMIEKMYELSVESFNISISNGKYAISRDGRLSKEYLNRFISEFYNLKNIYYEKYEYDKDNMDDVAKLVSLLKKIDVRYKFKETYELLNLFYPLLYSKSVQTSEINLNHLYAWFILSHSSEYSNVIIQLLIDNYKKLMIQVDQLQMNAGVQKGVVFTGHIANRFYQTFNIIECKDISVRCFDVLLRKQKFYNVQDEFGGWCTASQMLWGIHQNLYNGLSGIGLALIATISDNVPSWDECII